jgi:hypothetical protein
LNAITIQSAWDYLSIANNSLFDQEDEQTLLEKVEKLQRSLVATVYDLSAIRVLDGNAGQRIRSGCRRNPKTEGANTLMPTEDFVTIFADRQFKGVSAQLKPGDYNLNLGAVGNDNISSIRIPEGCEVTAFVDMNFGRDSKKFTADVADLASFDNKISSMKVRGNEGNERNAGIQYTIATYLLDDLFTKGETTP